MTKQHSFLEVKLNGATRIVILIGNYAVKIPRFVKCLGFYGIANSVLSGWSANRYEYVWSRSKIHKFLCPIKFSALFSFIIVMPRVTMLTENEFSDLDLELYNFGFEKKADSFGKYEDGEITVVDYA